MSQPHTRHLVAGGVAAALIGGFLLLPRAQQPFPTEQVAGPPAPATRAPAEVAALPAPAPEVPAAARPVGPESPEDAAVRARWEARLARQDEHLVAQAVAAGCDGERAAAMRRVLAERREARARTIEELRTGRIDDAQLTVQARETRRRTDEALQRLLSPTELAALDPVGARARVIEEEN